MGDSLSLAANDLYAHLVDEYVNLPALACYGGVDGNPVAQPEADAVALLSQETVLVDVSNHNDGTAIDMTDAANVTDAAVAPLLVGFGVHLHFASVYAPGLTTPALTDSRSVANPGLSSGENGLFSAPNAHSGADSSANALLDGDGAHVAAAFPASTLLQLAAETGRVHNMRAVQGYAAPAQFLLAGDFGHAAEAAYVGGGDVGDGLDGDDGGDGGDGGAGDLDHVVNDDENDVRRVNGAVMRFHFLDSFRLAARLLHDEGVCPFIGCSHRYRRALDRRMGSTRRAPRELQPCENHMRRKHRHQVPDAPPMPRRTRGA